MFSTKLCRSTESVVRPNTHEYVSSPARPERPPRSVDEMTLWRLPVKVSGVSNERIALQLLHMVHSLKLPVEETRKSISDVPVPIATTCTPAGRRREHCGTSSVQHRHRRNKAGKKPSRFSPFHVMAASTVNTIKHTSGTLVYVEFQTETRNEMKTKPFVTKWTWTFPA